MATVRIATRPSPLAKIQASRVGELLGTKFELVEVTTRGDREREVPISKMSGQGVFVKEVQTAVLDGRADLAVHSAKDLQSLPTTGLTIGAFPERRDPRDVLVGSTLNQLEPGARVATGSPRRRAQLRALRPDLVFCDIRGNMATRLNSSTAVVVALAALERLDLESRASQVFSLTEMIPQIGQGALAVECRSNDHDSLERLAGIDDGEVRRCLEAERAFLAELGGGCSAPVGAIAVLVGDDVLLTAVVEMNGILVKKSNAGPVGAELGRALAREFL